LIDPSMIPSNDAPADASPAPPRLAPIEAAMPDGGPAASVGRRLIG